MKSALVFTGRAIGAVGKVLIAVAILIGTFVMNCIGALICAIDS